MRALVRVGLLAGLMGLLSACQGSDGVGLDFVRNPPATDPAFVPPAGVTVDKFVTDASAVQSASPPTTGKADAGSPSGLLVYYTGSAPDKLVVFCHGLGHTVEQSWLPHMLRTVRPDTAIVTTNYRDNLQLPILRGAQDTIAATLMAKQRFPSIKTVYLLGVSLGGAVSGTALTESVHMSAEGRGLYDYWVAVEPLSNVFEAYPEAAAVLPEVAASLEEETGGNPLTQPEAYQRRSPALRTQDMAAAGLKAVFVVHSVNDGLVTYNQGRELALGLAAVQIPTQLYTVLRHAEGQNPGTTGTGTLIGAAGQEQDPFSPLMLSGHGSEADAAHPVMRTAFEQLNLMLDGTYDESTPYTESVVDDGG